MPTALFSEGNFCQMLLHFAVAPISQSVNMKSFNASSKTAPPCRSLKEENNYPIVHV